jgi:hypothetical protein
MGITHDQRAALIAQYKAGYDEVLKAIEGITAAEWESREGDGEWNAREIVHHLGDSEMNATARIRMLIADIDPVVMAYDERRWTDHLYTDRRPIEPSLAAFKAAREATAPLLDLMSDEDWTRPGKHSQRGDMTAETWLEWYGPHAHDHADQIRRARNAANRG